MGIRSYVRNRKPVTASRATESGVPSAWDSVANSNESIIAGKAVRTKGNPWGDSDGGKGHIADMVSDAWKSGGY